MSDNQALLNQILEEEQELVFPDFSQETARALGMSLMNHGIEHKLPIAIDITRYGHCLFHCGLEGSAPDNAQWVLRKNKVVQRFGHSSLYVGLSCEEDGVSFEDKYLLSPKEFAPFGGAFPITVANTGIIGTVTVSGLAQEEDHKLVVSHLRRLIQS